MENKAGQTVTLGADLSLEQFMQVARFGAEVIFSEAYIKRVEESRELAEKWIEEERVIYGMTTGFGALVTQSIKKEQAEQLQKNIILTHSTSVGEPMSEEQVRAVMLMVLQSLGKGLSGVRLKLLEQYRNFLNLGVVPYAPKHGSVGYLCPEAHIALVIFGEGQAYFKGTLYQSREALRQAGLEPLELSYKEGLALINGTTSPAALAAIAEYDLLNAVKAADVIAAVSSESLHGLVKAYDERIMSARPHEQMVRTADNMRRLLDGSKITEASAGSHVQDALSLRCIPQMHGAARNVLLDAKRVVELELNSCNDNPIIWRDGEDGEALSNGNPDASFLGLEMDSACIAATALAKMSERRNTRFIDHNLSGYPWFLVKNPGLNSGLMIPQYSQAGLLNEMKILSTPASVDSITTSGNQEDYVSMGYNACLKAGEVAGKLEYILAIELLSGYQAQQFMEPMQHGTGTGAVLDALKEKIPFMEQDMYLYPYIEVLREMIHSGELVRLAEAAAGEL